MRGRRGNLLYAWLVILLGWAILAGLFGQMDLDKVREFLLLIALGVLAEWLAVSFPQGQLSGGFAVVLFSYLTYGFEAAAWISVFSTLLGQGIVNRGNPLRTTLFNASQYVLALWLGNYVYLLLGGQRGAALTPNHWLSLAAFIVVYFLVNHLLVYLYLLPGRRRYPFLIWADTFRWNACTYILSTPFGVLMNLIYLKIGVLGSSLLFLPVLVAQFILRLYVHVELANRELFALYEIAKKLNEQPDLKGILGMVLKEVRRIVSFDAGIIYLWAEEKRMFAAAAVAGPHGQRWKNSMLTRGEGFMGWILDQEKPEVVFDTRTDPRLKKEPGLPQVYRSLLFVPLFLKRGTLKETLGLFVLGDKKPWAYDEHNLNPLSVICGQTAMAVVNALLLQRLGLDVNTDKLHVQKQHEDEFT